MSNELDARTALINDVLTAYHTTRLLETPAATHILSKGFVQDAFARLIEAERTAAIAAAVEAERERCAGIAEGFSRMLDKPDHADAPKLIAHLIRSVPHAD